MAVKRFSFLSFFIRFVMALILASLDHAGNGQKGLSSDIQVFSG